LQLGSGDKKPHNAPHCVSLCTINANDAAPSQMQKAHSVVCSELMTAVVDVQASAQVLRFSNFVSVFFVRFSMDDFACRAVCSLGGLGLWV
jgi:hypothetical protein